MAQRQELALASIGSILSTISDSKLFLVDPSNNDLNFNNCEKLSSNDSLTFIDEPNAIVTNLPSSKLIHSLPILLKKEKENSNIFNLNIKISNNDYSIITCCKDLGFQILISSNIRQSIDFTILSSFISKLTSKSVLHFYVESNDLFDITYYTTNHINKVYSQLTTSPDSDSSLTDAFNALKTIVGIQYNEFEIFNNNSASSTAKKNLVLLLGNPNQLLSNNEFIENNILISINVYRPFNLLKLNEIISSLTFNKLLIVEQSSINLQFQNLFLDLVEILSNDSLKNIEIIPFQILKIDNSNIDSVVKSINSIEKSSSSNLILGKSFNENNNSTNSIEVFEKSTDGAYLKILKESVTSNDLTFNPLNVLNDFQINSSPDYSLGKYLAHENKLNELIKLVENNLSQFNGDLNNELTNWLIKARDTGDIYDSTKLIELLKLNNSKFAIELLEFSKYFKLSYNWIIGSDNWSYDLGLSTFHSVLKSNNKRLKLLIIDSDSLINIKQGKKNLGLYAMNYKSSYVASIALYSSYTQALTSFIEANEYSNGPSIILAYLPKSNDYLELLKETKRVVDIGYWPLYRFNPILNNDSFKLDSSFIKKELKDFLDRENKLSLLISKNSKLNYNLKSINNRINDKINETSKNAFKDLLEKLSGAPITIAYASDGGNATNLANKLNRRALSKGLKAKILLMDDLSMDDLLLETNVVLITSTSGQGEFPNGGKLFWENLKNSTLDLANVKFSVFGLGDSKYWPRAEDAHYFNKPASDLFKKITNLGGQFLNDLGLGDDQADDGYNTAYNLWEPKLWESLGVSADNLDEPAPITNEDMKINSNFLRGTIAEGLIDESTGAICAVDQQLTKFHGIYMQDDRDIREERKKEGLEPAYSFMVRVRLPGGVSTPEQWLKIDELADTNGNKDFKITTRATYQLHGIIKKDLKNTIRDINTTAMDTLGACGDVNRNVMISALPTNRHLHSQMDHSSKLISARLLPSTTAYHEIWLTDLDEVSRGIEGKPAKIKIGGDALIDSEPIYSPVYLPRKFKVVIAMPPYNDVDCWAHDVGLISIVENNNIIGYNVLVGGGMGTTHNNVKTYPRTGSLFGFVKYDQVAEVCEKIMIVQRDNGDRKNRKHARLKYTIDDMGVETYKEKVEELLGYKFEEAKPFKIESNIDYFGWTKDETGLNHYTCFIENGRIEDVQGKPQKSGLKKIAHYFKDNKAGVFRLTGNQHILLSDIPDEHLDNIKKMLHEYNLDNLDHSSLRLSSGSCVAFPTCGLAMAEAERYLPVLINKLEDELEKLGLKNDSIVMRMTGCPNGCARPWVAEIALVGKSYGFYNLMLGGSYIGNRVNKIYKSNVNEEEILKILIPMFARWANERLDGEHFGDFVIRVGIIAETTEGKYFWDNVIEH
ncbi:sulfite reductase (NADPH) subunit beta [Pichia kluyveri]|uniref:assimilatory sulfite reductase (NADPH) n=1 Tax=Pichia kluyveri TaxID=36015 RepID=A0AAV5R7T6_PICKL|nr:sulfite reductase (NADPH) subunit beta [Pichia kluyveri]